MSCGADWSAKRHGQVSALERLVRKSSCRQEGCLRCRELSVTRAAPAEAAPLAQGGGGGGRIGPLVRQEEDGHGG